MRILNSSVHAVLQKLSERLPGAKAVAEKSCFNAACGNVPNTLKTLVN